MQYLPSSDVDVKFDLIEVKEDGSLITHTNKVFPISKSYTSGSKSSDLIQKLSIMRSTGGIYYLDMKLSGTSANEYSSTYPKGKDILVIGVDAEPATPTVLSAKFDNDGSRVVVEFDSRTNRAGLSTRFACETLFTFPGSDDATCQWDSDSVTHAYPSSALSSSKPVVSSSFQIKGNLLKARCTARANSVDPMCSNWNKTESASHTIAAPDTAVTPVVTVSAPNVIGSCDPLPLDLTSSRGGGGRPWSTVSFSVKSNTPAPSTDAADLKLWLETNYVFNPPTAIPLTSLTPGSRYNIVVKLCNFLGACSQGSHQFVVLKNIKPMVNIPGLKLKSVYRSEPLTLSSIGSISSCTGSSGGNITQTSQGLTYA